LRRTADPVAHRLLQRCQVNEASISFAFPRFAADLATIHGIPQEGIRTAFRQVTRAAGTGRVRSLAAGDWYERRKSDDQPYDVAPGFAAAWKKARGLP
jgi:hypothetical protein